MQSKIHVTKASGKLVPFDVVKLKRSLERSGAHQTAVNQIATQVEKQLFEGVSTKEIYKLAFSLLRKTMRPAAARYKLKTAIMELGPTGYPFERFVAEILNFSGFQTQVGVIMQGQCVDHEVDVLAEKDQAVFMIECKFHNDQRRHCDVKVPLYIQSRFKDLEAQWSKNDGDKSIVHQGWIYTNTRFTSDAVQYGTCSELGMVGWDYPKGNSLKEQIDRAGLHPITCLTTLLKHEKQLLLSMEVVLCKDLCKHPDLLIKAGIPQRKIPKVLKEAQSICSV